MVNVQKSITKPTRSLAQRLALIVGGICLLGFIIDILVIGLPPNPLAAQWRLNFLQQVSERSLLLFIGCVLMLYSKLDSRKKQLRIFSITCVLIGIGIGLSSLLVIEDNLTLQRQAETNINNQAAELRARITESQNDKALSQDITADAFSKALRNVNSQAEALKQETQTGAMKTLIASAGNLFLVSAGLLGIGRIGLINSFSQNRQRRYYPG